MEQWISNCTRDENWLDAVRAIVRLADQAQDVGNRRLAEQYIELAMAAFDTAAQNRGQGFPQTGDKSFPLFRNDCCLEAAD